jgi:uncharacterized protein YwqG
MLFERVPQGKHALGPDDWLHALGLRSKLGGAPDWVQSNETPECSRCHKPMTFVGQIDSFEVKGTPNTVEWDDRHFMFGDVGMIYVFFCFGCSNTQSIFQGG